MCSWCSSDISFFFKRIGLLNFSSIYGSYHFKRSSTSKIDFQEKSRLHYEIKREKRIILT